MKSFLFTYTGKPIGNSGESSGTEYNLNQSCVFCGSGSSTKKNLTVQGLNKQLQDLLQTIDGDYIISENLYNQMILDDIRINFLSKVVDKTGNFLPFYHLYAKNTLPKATKITGLIKESSCEQCKRSGYFNDIKLGDLEKGIPTKVFPVELTYEKNVSQLFNHNDIFNSWEEMGVSNNTKKENMVIRYSRPLLIVSEKFKKFMENHKINNLKFEEIKILN
jgi:hypothetical protein